MPATTTSPRSTPPTVEQLREPAQRVADRIEALMNATAPVQGNRLSDGAQHVEG